MLNCDSTDAEVRAEERREAAFEAAQERAYKVSLGHVPSIATNGRWYWVRCYACGWMANAVASEEAAQAAFDRKHQQVAA